MVALLSCASPLSPRMMNMRQTFSRRSRRVEKVRKGSVLERVLTMAHFPGLPCDARSEEHTSELQSRLHLVCRLLLEKKKKTNRDNIVIYCCRQIHVTHNLQRLS